MVIVGLVALLVAGSGPGVSAKRAPTQGAVPGAALPCNQFPTPAPLTGAPTPLAAPPLAALQRASAPRVTVIGAWASCFRPQMVTIDVGELVQWQQVDAQAQPEVVLDDGTVVGPVRMILEVRFNRPGHFPYHSRSNPQATGTVIVQGTGLAGPVLDIDGPPGTSRKVWQLP